MTNKAPALLSVAQAADELHLSTRAVLHRITKGDLAATKVGTGRTSAYVIQRAEVDRAKTHGKAAS